MIELPVLPESEDSFPKEYQSQQYSSPSRDLTLMDVLSSVGTISGFIESERLSMPVALHQWLFGGSEDFSQNFPSQLHGGPTEVDTENIFGACHGMDEIPDAECNPGDTLFIHQDFPCISHEHEGTSSTRQRLKPVKRKKWRKLGGEELGFELTRKVVGSDYDSSMEHELKVFERLLELDYSQMKQSGSSKEGVRRRRRRKLHPRENDDSAGEGLKAACYAKPCGVLEDFVDNFGKNVTSCNVLRVGKSSHSFVSQPVSFHHAHGNGLACRSIKQINIASLHSDFTELSDIFISKVSGNKSVENLEVFGWNGGLSRLRRKQKWNIQKAHKQVKSKHCYSVHNAPHGKSLHVNHRVAKRMSLQIVCGSQRYQPSVSFRLIDKQKGFPREDSKQLASVKNPRPVESCSSQCKTKPPPASTGSHHLTAYNADRDLPPDVVNLLVTLQDRDITPDDYDLLLRLDERVAAKTVDATVISRLKCVTVTPSDPIILEGGCCMICMELYAVGSAVTYLPCKHYFHNACIKSWLTESSTKCPLDGLIVS